MDLISILNRLMHKKFENMNDSFIVYKDSVILYKVLECPIHLVWTEMHFYIQTGSNVLCFSGLLVLNFSYKQ